MHRICDGGKIDERSGLPELSLIEGNTTAEAITSRLYSRGNLKTHRHYPVTLIKCGRRRRGRGRALVCANLLAARARAAVKRARFNYAAFTRVRLHFVRLTIGILALFMHLLSRYKRWSNPLPSNPKAMLSTTEPSALFAFSRGRCRENVTALHKRILGTFIRYGLEAV
ncbi:hypothetical protein EVAR_93353_1 [Eumeta japonica]|uniref:Uncharacterized protein n=1 Tax=Eumeta variegata TaxID=151549 RepID=A0A4C1UU96_EUMVA|nr:hypothetical protein EVAR_93353_1 [Eumeta japonica]